MGNKGNSTIIWYNDYDLSDYMRQNRIKEVRYHRDFKIPKNVTGRFRPYPFGLFDPHIFGYKNHCECPVRDGLRTYYPGTGPAIKCPSCDCMVMSEDDYLQRFSTYSLKAPYISFIKVRAAAKELRNIFGKLPYKFTGTLADLWSLYVYTGDTEFEIPEISSDGQITYSPTFKFFDGQKEVWVGLSDLPGKDANDLSNKDIFGKPVDINKAGLFGLKYLSSLYFGFDGEGFRIGDKCNIIGDMINWKLIISSPGRHLRKASKVHMDSGTPKLVIGPETTNYYAIMTYNERLEYHLNSPYLSITDKATYCWFMNVMINSHIHDNELLQTSRESLTRQNLDTRVPRGGRALIVASIDLPMDTVGLPKTFVYKAMQTAVIERLSDVLREEAEEQGLEANIEDAKELYKRSDPKAYEVLHELIEPQIDEDGNEYVPAMCKLVRNPSLHKYNMTSFKIKLIEGTAIHFPIATDEGYNADH